VLRTILRKALQDMTDWDLEELGPLSGGYVLQHGEILIAPGCCGDLANLHDWSVAAKHTSESWEMVWIGHPWTHVRASEDILHFAEPSEISAPVSPVEALRLDRPQLQAAIAAAQSQRHSFGESVTLLIEELCPRVPVQEVVEVLLRGHHPTPEEAA
jgi:hypothetical protein